MNVEIGSPADSMNVRNVDQESRYNGEEREPDHPFIFHGWHSVSTSENKIFKTTAEATF